MGDQFFGSIQKQPAEVFYEKKVFLEISQIHGKTFVLKPFFKGEIFEKLLTYFLCHNIWSDNFILRSLVVSELRSETKGFRFKSGC